MIKISDFKFKNVDQLTFKEAPMCDCGKTNCRCILNADENNNMDSMISYLLNTYESLDAVCLIVFLDNTAKAYIPFERICEEDGDSLKIGIETFSKEEAFTKFPAIVENGYFSNVIIFEQASKFEYFTISPGNIRFDGYDSNYDEGYNYDVLTSAIQKLFQKADERNLDLYTYFDLSISNKDKYFFKQVELILDMAAFHYDKHFMLILISILSSYKSKEITEDQLIYYILDGPTDIINKIKNNLKLTS